MTQLNLKLPIKITPTQNNGYVIKDSVESEYFFYTDKESGELIYDGCCVAVKNIQFLFEHLKKQTKEVNKEEYISSYVQSLIRYLSDDSSSEYREILIKSFEKEAEKKFNERLKQQEDPELSLVVVKAKMTDEQLRVLVSEIKTVAEYIGIKLKIKSE